MNSVKIENSETDQKWLLKVHELETKMVGITDKKLKEFATRISLVYLLSNLSVLRATYCDVKDHTKTKQTLIRVVII